MEAVKYVDRILPCVIWKLVGVNYTLFNYGGRVGQSVSLVCVLGGGGENVKFNVKKTFVEKSKLH